MGRYSGWRKGDLDRQEKGLLYSSGVAPARPFLPLDLSFPVCPIRELNNKKKDDPRLFSVNDLDS